MNLIDDMFWNWRHPVGWGWGGGYGGGWGNTYNFYPEHEYYRDYYSGQAPPYEGMTMTFCIALLAAWAVVALGAAYVIFLRKDVFG